MSELTLTVIRLGLLVLLWIFVFSVVGVLRGDLYGTRVVNRAGRPKAAARNTPAGGRGGQAPAATSPPATMPSTAGASAMAGAAAAPIPAKAPKAARLSRGAGKRTPTSLVVTEGPLAGTTISLKDSGVLLGRNPECTLVLDDDFASGRHARIARGPQGWFVEDLGSTNGTYLGNTRLTTRTPVEAGSTLRIGKTVIELRK